MSFIRSTTLRASAIVRAARPAVRTAQLQPWQRTIQRRTYASEGHHPASQTSDVPWAAAAAVGTALGLYIVVTQDTGAHHEDHGDSHTEKHDDAPADDESKDKDEDEAQDESKEDAKTEGKDESEDDKPTEENKVAPAPKSPNSPEKENESPDRSDKPDPRKKETKSQNEMSGKQKGISNDNTEHSSQISKHPEKSKKGEGVAETAKLQGTVSTDRPGAENKEERGKAQMDKDA